MRRGLRLLIVIVAVLGPIVACEDDPTDLDYLKGGSGGSSGKSAGAGGAGTGGSGAGGGGSAADVDAGG